MWFVDKLGPLPSPNSKSAPRGAKSAAPQKGAKAAAAPRAQPARPPAPEPKKKKGWF
jgi:hypothetical protein